MTIAPTKYPLDIDKLRAMDWWARVDIRGEHECWPWKQSSGSHGYGQTWDGKSVRLAHRVAWVLHHEDDIPEDMTVDHTCYNRKCCNPRHLQLLPNKENARNNGNSRKTHCPKGHEYTSENVYIQPSNGSRRCRACATASGGRKS